MENTKGVTMAPLNQMRKTTVIINPITGEVKEEIVSEPGENKYKALQEARRKKLGV